MSIHKKAEVAVDRGSCNGCQGCVDLNPDVFEWDEGADMPVVIRPEATREEIQDILNCCPGDCIFIDE